MLACFISLHCEKWPFCKLLLSFESVIESVHKSTITTPKYSTTSCKYTKLLINIINSLGIKLWEDTMNLQFYEFFSLFIYFFIILEITLFSMEGACCHMLMLRNSLIIVDASGFFDLIAHDFPLFK